MRHHGKTLEVDPLLARVVKVELQQFEFGAAYRDGVVAHHVHLYRVAVVDHAGTAGRVVEPDRFRRSAQRAGFLDMDRRLAPADRTQVEVGFELAPGLWTAGAVVGPMHIAGGVCLDGLGGSVAGQGRRFGADILATRHRVRDRTRGHVDRGGDRAMRRGGSWCRRRHRLGRGGRFGQRNEFFVLAADRQGQAFPGGVASVHGVAHLFADFPGHRRGRSRLPGRGRRPVRRCAMVLRGGRACCHQQPCHQAGQRRAADNGTSPGTVGQGGSGISHGARTRSEGCRSSAQSRCPGQERPRLGPYRHSRVRT